ncbi:MAG TPA: hypothetical protein VF784_06755 [Anaerolineales bacterium]
MSIDLSALNFGSIVWLAAAVVVVLIVFGIFRFFFQHLMHLFFRGCGLIVVVLVLLYVLHLFKLI